MSRRKQSRRPTREARHPVAERAPAPPAGLLATLEDTREQTAQLVHSLDSHRAQSERVLREVNRHALDLGRMLRGITDVLDAFDRLLDERVASDLDSMRHRVRQTARLLTDVLGDNSRLELIGRVGEPADPATHQVLEVRDATGVPADVVLGVAQRGLRYDGELVRPAAVIVSSGKDMQA